MSLRHTAFHRRTAALGATFVEYAGYDFPSQYAADLTEEYWACRRAAVVIDLTPLRKVEVTGPGAEALLQATVTRDLDASGTGRGLHGTLRRQRQSDRRRHRVPLRARALPMGRLHRRGRGLVPWARRPTRPRGVVRNTTDRLHNISVQGPASRDIVTSVVSTSEGRPTVSDLTWFRFTEGRIGGPDGPAAVVSRTGYSGELGYEVWCHPDDGPSVWDAVWTVGEAYGLAPLGLNALDVVRVDAGLIFKGYEYEGAEDPFEAGIGFVVTKDKPDDFVGKATLDRRRRHPTQSLVGLEVEGVEPVAHGDTVVAGGQAVGVVTSGAFSPGLEKNLALARVEIGHAGLSTLGWNGPAQTRRRLPPPSSLFRSTIPTRPVPVLKQNGHKTASAPSKRGTVRFDLLIRHGHLVDPLENRDGQFDVAI